QQKDDRAAGTELEDVSAPSGRGGHDGAGGGAVGRLDGRAQGGTRRQEGTRDRVLPEDRPNGRPARPRADRGRTQGHEGPPAISPAAQLANFLSRTRDEPGGGGWRKRKRPRRRAR